MILTVLRCDVCGAEIEGSTLNERTWKAKDLGWQVTSKYGSGALQVICSDHFRDGLLQIPDPKWTLECSYCGCDLVDDYKEDFLTQKEAEEAQRNHQHYCEHCDTYRWGGGRPRIITPEMHVAHRARLEESRKNSVIKQIMKEREAHMANETKKRDPQIGEAISIYKNNQQWAAQIQAVHKNPPEYEGPELEKYHAITAVSSALNLGGQVLKYSTKPFEQTWCYPGEREDA